MADFSFDIVSEIDRQELTNALDQVRKEITTRYDFKDVPVEIVNEKEQMVITTADDYKFKAVMEIIKSKFIRRGLSLGVLGEEKSEPASGGKMRITIKFVEGVDSEKAKQINKFIREKLPKVKTVIQGETIRVSSKSKDELQTVMDLLKNNQEIAIPLQFINYR
ncbi:YajQ family cyclic di-GMP-binding protein [Patescibacteria group bacterium]|nr:YajQ family cyclic di-GMP-binding protein [Patescibacteria group bacterium]